MKVEELGLHAIQLFRGVLFQGPVGNEVSHGMGEVGIDNDAVAVDFLPVSKSPGYLAAVEDDLLHRVPV